MSNSLKIWLKYTAQDIGLIVLVIVLAIIALLSELNSLVVFAIASGIIIFLLMLILNYTLNLRKPKQLKKIVDSDLWVHWRYEAGEWQKLINDTEIQKKNEQQAKLMLPFLRQNTIVFTVLFAGLTGFMLRNEGWQALIGIVVVGCSVFALSYRSMLRVKRDLSNPYSYSKPEVYISSVGIAYGENGILFSQPKLSIEDVEVEVSTDPAQFHIIMGYETGKKRIPYDLTIPIPIDRDNEANMLVKHFHSELINSKSG